MLSSMTRLAGFCPVFVELNGIEELVSLKGRFGQEDSAKTFLELIWGLSFYGSEAAIPLLTSPIPNDLIDLLQTSHTGTTELILKTLVNIGIDNRELFQSQLGAALLQSLCILLYKTLPIHHQHLFFRDGIAFIGESPQDTSTELSLKLLILVVEGSDQLKPSKQFVQTFGCLLRHCSTDIVLFVLRTLLTLTSDSHFARTMRMQIPVAQINGNTRPIPMINIIAELFGAYLSRLRAQIGQIQLLWTTEPDNAMLLDRNTNTGGTDASEPLNVVKITTQISATCEVLSGLSHMFSSAVFWEERLNEMLLDCEMLRYFGDFFSFYRETVKHENHLRKQNPTIDLSWMDSRMTIKEDTARVLESCLNGIANLFVLSMLDNKKIHKAIYPQHQHSDEHFFFVLSTLLALGVPHLTQPVTRIVKKILKWIDADYSTLLVSGLIEVLFRYVIESGIDNEQTETILMKIANSVLLRGLRNSSSENYRPRIERDSAYRLYCLLVQSNFVEMMESCSQKRTEDWKKEHMEFRSSYSEYDKSLSDLSSPSSAFSIECVPFLRWPDNQEASRFGHTVVFQSLVATLKLQPELDVSLEKKAAKFLESLTNKSRWFPDDLLIPYVSHSDGSLTDFVPSILVLLSSPNQVIKTASMKMLQTVVANCSAPLKLLLVKADVFDQLIVSLNPLLASSPDSKHIHSKLLSIIANSVWLITPISLSELEIKDPDEQQALRETVLKQVFIPSKQYICYLCSHYHFLVVEDMSTEFTTLLSQILEIYAHCHPTMEYVLTLPVFLASSSCLTFFESDDSINSFLEDVVDSKEQQNEQGGDIRESEMTIVRSLRMEGIDDVIEERLMNDRSTNNADHIVVNSIEWSNMLGMNYSEDE
ncbi:hypothetical protein BLNAU_5133 [Blattamonas nauphoetae]|uniref:Uncharacterized protein n=1 Tax=Blattamonas nauphoetae TaxID=2049346 RepID=A0ABQ9Y845_9EUKA|nr:hypothetical protein BLNAU_5133 [Blattamonas nauphoetae]